jgi:hypothetical protein
MKVGQTLDLPGINEDGSLLVVEVKKIFRDGTIWLFGKNFNKILKKEEVEEILAKR